MSQKCQSKFITSMQLHVRAYQFYHGFTNTALTLADYHVPTMANRVLLLPLIASLPNPQFIEMCSVVLACLLAWNSSVPLTTRHNKQSEPIGLIVLERCCVELDLNEELPYSFQLVFEGDERIRYLAALSEEDRDTWIEALHIASYECMKMQLECLREQIRSKTGRDPIDQPTPSLLDDVLSVSDQDGTVIELCLKCSDLPRGPQGLEPCPMVIISTITPPQQSWCIFTHTETIERSSNPVFMKTICINWKSISTTTRVKLSVYDVKERLTETMAQIGSVVFTMGDIIRAKTHELELSLGEDCGRISVTAWQEDSAFEHFVDMNDGAVEPETSGGQFLDYSLSTIDSRDLPLELHSPHVTTKASSRTQLLRPLYDNITSRTYRFPSNNGMELKVFEYMGESKLAFHIPRELLKLWIEEEKVRMTQLQDLGSLPEEWETVRSQLQTLHMSVTNSYTQCLRYLKEYKGPPFKASCKRLVKELEFIPINLHLQRLWVTNEITNTNDYYDITTVGAFAAFPMKFKQGGLRKLILQFRDQYSSRFDGEPCIKILEELLNTVSTLREEIHFQTDAVHRASLQQSGTDLKESIKVLEDKTRQLIMVSQHKLLEDAVRCFEEIKRRPIPARPVTEYRPPDVRERVSDARNKWRHTGIDSIIENDPDSWENSRSNLEFTLLSAISRLDNLLASALDKSQTWLQEMTPFLTNVKSAVEIVCRRGISALTFKMIQDVSSNVGLWHSIKYRRDVVFSHAVTALTTAFITQIMANISDETFMQQVLQIGILAEFEALLSCYGEEMSMIEDMVVAIYELNNVRFRIKHSADPDRILPRLYTDRSAIIVEVPAPANQYHLLPVEVQRGHLIKVVPVFFNVGINEQATLAEKFGDSSLQETINEQSMNLLCDYHQQFADLSSTPVLSKSSMALSEQITRFRTNVLSNKSKNVEILHQSREITRCLRGLRFTSCKSAKDRTAMGVTLEQANLLLDRHHLAQHHFLQTLQCMRSEGVRRENTYKNTGIRKYAFNSLRVLSLPKLYRPPTGTYGNIQT